MDTNTICDAQPQPNNHNTFVPTAQHLLKMWQQSEESKHLRFGQWLCVKLDWPAKSQLFYEPSTALAYNELVKRENAGWDLTLVEHGDE